MTPAADSAYVAFEGDRRIGSGSLRDVARAAREALDRRQDASILIFESGSSAPVDIDLRGSVDDVLARIPPATIPADEETVVAAPRGRARNYAAAAALGLAGAAKGRRLGGDPQAGRRGTARKRGRRSYPPRAGSGLPFHVCDGRQPAALRGGDPCAVRRRPAPFRKIDRRMARGCPRPYRKIGGAGIPTGNLSRRRLIPP